MMQTVKGFAQAGEDGLLKITLPVGVANAQVEYVIVWRQIPVGEVDSNGWPIGYFDRTYGSMADDPMDEIEQLPPEERDEIE